MSASVCCVSVCESVSLCVCVCLSASIGLSHFVPVAYYPRDAMLARYTCQYRVLFKFWEINANYLSNSAG